MSSLCGKCGVPRNLSRSHAWRDGCIIDKAGKTASLFAYEVASANAFIEEVGLLLDIPIDDIVYSAASYDSEQLVRDFLGSRPFIFRLSRRPNLFGLFFHLVADFGKASGIGNVELLEKRVDPGEMAIKMRVSDPFNLSFVSAVIVGATQAMFDSPVTLQGTKEGTGYVMHVHQVGDGDRGETHQCPASARLIPRDQGKEGELAPCRRCGAPRKAGTAFSWDFQRGVVIERTSNERIFFPGLYLLNSLIEELERELGSSIYEPFMKVEKKLFGRKLARTSMGSELWDESRLRDYLSLRGLGMLKELRVEGKKVDITAENVFIAPLFAGRLITLWEYRFGGEAQFDLALEDNMVSLSIHPSAPQST